MSHFIWSLGENPSIMCSTLILPCVFIIATAVLVFYLPAESGEKVLADVFHYIYQIKG